MPRPVKRGMTLRRASITTAVVVAVVAMALAVTTMLTGSSTAGADTPPAPVVTAPSTTSPTTTVAPSTTVAPPTSTTTTAPPATSTTAVPRQPEPETAGDADVAALQRRLADLGYDPGPADGVFGARTASAVMAFQKVEGLDRTGEAGPDVVAALADAGPPAPLVPDGEATRVEIDLSRQVLLFWQNGVLDTVLPTSTGSGEYYCVGGDCEYATTPTGSYRVGRKYAGTEVGPLGPLAYPMYFNGGIAIHGSASVPAYPASHGCARIPMWAAPVLFEKVPAGTAVHVVE